tara:strand:- start:2329 stop:2523 length:195 start_codon:yes stop_codon:yes gene_type:complete
MKELTVFIAEDGATFDNKEDCIKWEKISANLEMLRVYIGNDSFPHEILQPLKVLFDPFLQKTHQ